MSRSDNPSLFDDDDDEPRGRARRDDPDTSHQSAASISARTEREVAALFVNGDGRTDDEICAALPHLYPPTVKSARSRLTGHGLLVDLGQTRPSNRGRAMTVWYRRP